MDPSDDQPKPTNQSDPALMQKLRELLDLRVLFVGTGPVSFEEGGSLRLPNDWRQIMPLELVKYIDTNRLKMRYDDCRPEPYILNSEVPKAFWPIFVTKDIRLDGLDVMRETILALLKRLFLNLRSIDYETVSNSVADPKSPLSKPEIQSLIDKLDRENPDVVMEFKAHYKMGFAEFLRIHEKPMLKAYDVVWIFVKVNDTEEIVEKPEFVARFRTICKPNCLIVTCGFDGTTRKISGYPGDHKNYSVMDYIHCIRPYWGQPIFDYKGIVQRVQYITPNFVPIESGVYMFRPKNMRQKKNRKERERMAKYRAKMAMENNKLGRPLSTSARSESNVLQLQQAESIESIQLKVKESEADKAKH